VAWARITEGTPLKLNDIHVFQNWPGDDENKHFVPSTFAYSDGGLSDKWGYDAESEPTAIRHVKLELEPATTLESLDTLSELIRTLTELEADATLPVSKHVTQSPSDIIADYLRGILVCIHDSISEKYTDNELGESSIDFAVTHPAVCNPIPPKNT